MNWRRKKNMIRGIELEGAWVEALSVVKEEASKFFKKRFREYNWEMPQLDGVVFKKISREDNYMLVGGFGEEETK